MSFLRPEALNGLARWRDVLIGAAVALAGLVFTTVGTATDREAFVAVLLLTSLAGVGAVAVSRRV